MIRTIYSEMPQSNLQTATDQQPAKGTLRIAFIASDFPPMLGGIAQFMYDIIIELPLPTIDASAIALKTPGWAEFDALQEFPILRVAPLRGRAHTPSHMKFLTHRYVRKLAAADPVDFVVCNHGNLWLMMAAWIHSCRGGTPYGVFLHGLDVFNAQYRRSAPLYNALLRRAHIVFANGSATHDAAVRSGVAPERIAVIHPCVRPEKLVPNISPKEVRARYNLEDKRVILTIGRLVQRKGVNVLIEAMTYILETIPNAHLLIVGDGEAREQLASMVQQLELTEHVTFTGPQPHNQVPNFYQIADVFAMTTQALGEGDIESFGIVYLEANLLGLPVVATEVGGVADAVVDGETGLLLKNSDVGTVASAAIQLLEDQDLARRLASRGRERVLSEFSCQRMAKKLIDVIEQSLRIGQTSKRNAGE